MLGYALSLRSSGSDASEHRGSDARMDWTDTRYLQHVSVVESRWERHARWGRVAALMEAPAPEGLKVA